MYNKKYLKYNENQDSHPNLNKDAKHLYLKYKNKYLMLKELLGGGVFRIIQYPNGDKYQGEWKDDMKDGYGMFTYINGNKYKGKWKDDMKDGYGIFIYAAGDKYKGRFKNDMANGRGIITYANGNIYEGEFKDDIFHGYGTFINATGCKYKGNFKNNMMDGDGTLIFADGGKYKGNFKNDMMDGDGIFTDINGDVYKGEWKDDMRDGNGISTYANGDKYEGEFKNNIFHGVGTLIFADGTKYKGNFKDDMFHGDGTLIFADGTTYKGKWKDDMKDGDGIFTYATGCKYEGIFKDNMCHGYGTFIYPDGRTYTGLWEYDKAVITITEPEKYNDSLESYEIILFLSAHGCDIKDDLLNRYLPEEFKEHIDLKYVGSSDYTCEVSTINNNVDIMSSYVLFNNKTSIEEQIKEYQLVRRKKIQYSFPNYNHKYYFDTNNEYLTTGIFISKNNIGLPNNINIFDWTNASDMISDLSTIDMIDDLSTIFASKIVKENDYKTMTLSAILNSFYTWHQKHSKLKDKKLHLILVDNSCRVICD